ncbi:MAG: hypothetical protein M0C28_04485 [Candidatus Moduliflexus flocculans]|nr:hypothetical protein [Candidatus Moduliflexus flocculans]
MPGQLRPRAVPPGRRRRPRPGDEGIGRSPAPGARGEMSGQAFRSLPPDDASWRLEAYLARGGYEAARRAVTSMAPADVVAEVRKAGLRGREARASRPG